MFKFTRIMKCRGSYDRGFTLVEVLAVVVILGILAAIAVPSVGYLIEKSREDVCWANRTELSRQYEFFLKLASREHTELTFKRYLIENDSYVCPSGGVFGYEDGVVDCSVHSHSDDGDKDVDDGEVPYL